MVDETHDVVMTDRDGSDALMESTTGDGERSRHVEELQEISSSEESSPLVAWMNGSVSGSGDVSIAGKSRDRAKARSGGV